jgi:hypothetical protein
MPLPAGTVGPRVLGGFWALCEQEQVQQELLALSGREKGASFPDLVHPRIPGVFIVIRLVRAHS